VQSYAWVMELLCHNYFLRMLIYWALELLCPTYFLRTGKAKSCGCART
jgi:hypothetical protein